MGPKQKGGSGSGGGGGGGNKQKGNATEEVEETLQAVVFADTFETRFDPLTLEKPRCLLPLANTPLIEYTLEFLANAGVQDVFLYGGAHSNLLEKHISTSRWKASSSPFRKLTFLKSTSTSVGDIMRDLDGKHLITGDFIAVSGDVVSNFPIDEALSKHRARRQADRNAIMTMVLREAGAQHRSKASSVSPVFIVDPTKDRCLHYEEIDHRNKSSSSAAGAPARLTIDTEILTTHAEIDIRQDLIDCNIDICTPDVLSLWSDSFDYQAPRKHFLYGVLKDYELNGKTIHTHIIKDRYAARVRNLKAYDAVTKDIISRWTYPLCPDTNLVPGHTYELRRGNIYQEQGVILARSCVIGRRTVIGQGTSIGDGATVTNSVLGRNCRIGKNVIIDGAYIWDGTVVGDNSEIRQVIVAENVVVGAGCKIEPDVLLSFGVRIADGVKVVEGTRVTAAALENGSVPANEEHIVGPGGRGYEYVGEEDEDDEDDRSESSGLIYNMANLSLSNESISTLSSDISAGEEYYHGNRSDSFGTSVSEDEDHDHFQHDASNNLFESMRDGVSADVVALELVSLRMSANASDHQVRHAVASSFMKRVSQLITDSGKNASEAIRDVFTRYKDVVERCLFDKNKEVKSDQIDLLLQIQRDLVHRTKGDTILLFAAKELYDLDIVEEEAFEGWWNDERSTATEELKKVRAQTQQFVDWLANASEEDDDDDDSEEEEDDEDEDEDDNEDTDE